MPVPAQTAPAAPYDPAAPDLTPRIVAELIAHEGIVGEAYRDSVGVWTWSVGLTDASGHKVERYRDNPQSLSHCMAVFIWALRRNYLPPVIAAFGDRPVAERELAAALSFHWNTGGIARAEWMRLAVAGDRERARAAMLNWAKPASLLGRRRKEQSLFFDGVWSNDGTALVYGVAKPSYRPIGGRRVAIDLLLGDILAPAADTIADPVRAEPEPAESPVPTDAPGSICKAEQQTGWLRRILGIG
ncbi:MAG: hypothetical protein CL820_17315 [Croceicoccus sp.]|nr:hypothetical protein [Croceicoccus sp.]|tara:strand:+ start:9124 stop:9855 length:732 start_codon:yes stop_codon:yes gene_type:complete